jgi:TRAP-type mannitol/chloroaromatic compound transport system permease small subunit
MAALQALSSVASAIGTLWIFGLMLLIGADVLGRQLFNTPVLGVTEIVSQSIVGIVFLQLADAQRRGRMIRSDIILAGLLRRRPAIGHVLLTFHNLAGAVLMTLICYFSFPRFINAFERDEYVGSFGNFTMPIWPFIGIIVLASAMSALYYLNFVLNPRLAAETELASPDHG